MGFIRLRGVTMWDGGEAKNLDKGGNTRQGWGGGEVPGGVKKERARGSMPSSSANAGAYTEPAEVLGCSVAARPCWRWR